MMMIISSRAITKKNEQVLVAEIRKKKRRASVNFRYSGVSAACLMQKFTQEG